MNQDREAGPSERLPTETTTVAEVAAIQDTISNYLRGKRLDDQPDSYCYRHFVGMIETGEATYEDFAAVGGEVLAAAVADTKRNLDKTRTGATR